MKSLIWKEWRETLWIAISLLVLCLVSSLYWKVMLPSPYQELVVGIWVLLALFLGARAFAGEKHAGTIEFLAAQPLQKAHLWAMKAGWGFSVVIAVVAISSLFDYMLMRGDPFYRAFHLLELPLSWILLSLLAVYAVALLSSTVSDKTVVALGLNIVLWPVIGVGIALIERFNPHFYQFVNERWGAPLALCWFSLVVLAVSFAIVTWREVWPNYPVAVKAAGGGAAVGTVIVLLILSTANIPPQKVTAITWLGGGTEGPAARRGPLGTIVFSALVGEKEVLHWEIDNFSDEDNFRKSMNPPFRERKHPAWSSKHIEARTADLVVMRIDAGENAGGYVIEKLERPIIPPFIPHRVRTTIRPIEGSSLSWLGLWSVVGRWGFRDQFYFVEELPDGQKHLAVARAEQDKIVSAARGGTMEAISPNRRRFILSTPSEGGKIRVGTVIWGESPWSDISGRSVEMDLEISTNFSFVTETMVQYKLGGKTFLADSLNLDRPGFEVPQGVLTRGPDALRRLAEGLENVDLRRVRDLPQVAPVLESVAAGWGVDVPEELFDVAIFIAPRNRQIVYVKKENEQQSSVWLLEVESGESKRILDDIDVSSPAVPEALVAPVMSDYLAFVRDTKTIWTYRDGTLTQIFPPDR